MSLTPDNSNYVDEAVRIDLDTSKFLIVSVHKGDATVMVTRDKLWELLNARIKAYPIYDKPGWHVLD